MPLEERKKETPGIKFQTPATKQLGVSRIRLQGFGWPCDAKRWVIFVNDRSKSSEPSLRYDNEPRGCALDLVCRESVMLFVMPFRELR